MNLFRAMKHAAELERENRQLRDMLNTLEESVERLLEENTRLRGQQEHYEELLDGKDRAIERMEQLLGGKWR